MADRPVVEVYPKSMVENRKPGLIEPAYGIYEKSTGDVNELPIVFTIKEKALIHTHNWLSPVLFTFEAQRGALIVRDVLSASPHASYTLTSIGGERIKKSAEIGVLYVNTRPVNLRVMEEYEGLTREKLRAKMLLRGLILQVEDIVGFLMSMWRKYGMINIDRLLADTKKAFRETSQRIFSNISIEDLLSRPVSVEEEYMKELSARFNEFKLKLLMLDTRVFVDDDVFNYYFWHIVNEIPPLYTYLLTVLNRIPDKIKDKVPRAVELAVLGLLARDNPEIVRILRTYIEPERNI